MTTSRDQDGSRRPAEFYEARARNYRRQAVRLLERDEDSDSASALIYESAKQCINAVSSLRGENPATTGAKIRVLRDIAYAERDGATIIRDWEDAFKLHIHADRGILEGRELTETLELAQDFIDAMLAIYERERSS